MLSSDDLAGDSARCRELGIAVYLTKPITQAELWEAIKTALTSQPPERPAPARPLSPRRKPRIALSGSCWPRTPP